MNNLHIHGNIHVFITKWTTVNTYTGIFLTIVPHNHFQAHMLLSSVLFCLSIVFFVSHQNTCSGFQPAWGIQCANITPSFYYLQSETGFVTAMGGWIQRIQIFQNSMSSPSVSSVLKTGPRCADDQTDLWCNLCKPFAPCELENQRQDFRMALGQRLSSLCYLIANFHRLFSFTFFSFTPLRFSLWFL